MKILAVADYPALLKNDKLLPDEIGDVDVILSCGDLSWEYLAALSRHVQAPLYFVRGNHDIRTDTVQSENCVDIHHSIVSLGARNIMGLEGSHWYNGGPCQYTEARMKQMVRQMKPAIRKRGGIDIVITHAAPRRIHDSEDMCHRGFKAFRWLIHRYKPAYFFHGHIHGHFPDPGDRVTRIEATNVVNCCGYYYLDLEDE